MISFLEGEILFIKDDSSCVLNQGVGYDVRYIKGKIKDKVKLYIFHEINERSNILWGFNHYNEYLLFKELIEIDSVGTKKAFKILNEIPYKDFVRIVLDREISLFNVKGIGKKTIEIIFDYVISDKNKREYFMELLE